jgi:hypothetical protein
MMENAKTLTDTRRPTTDDRRPTMEDGRRTTDDGRLTLTPHSLVSELLIANDDDGRKDTIGRVARL